MGRELRNVPPNHEHPKDDKGNYIPMSNIRGGKKKTWLQVYENVSDGTPVTPPFEKEEEIVEYLSTKGDYWRQQEGAGGYEVEACRRFIKDKYAPSFATLNGKIYESINCCLLGKEN